MIIRILFLLAFYLSAMFCVSAQSLPPTRDFQVWNETAIAFPLIRTKDEKGKVTDRVSFLLLGVLRLGQNRLVPVDERIGFAFDIRVNKNFTFTPSYLYRHVEPGRGRHGTEHEIRFEITYERPFKHFSIKDRPRIEYHARNSRSDTVIFRNKLTLKLPVKRDGKELFTPFIADEPFYDFHQKRWNSNEFSVGIGKKLNKTVSAEAFYLLRNTHLSLPKQTNAVGVNLRFRID